MAADIPGNITSTQTLAVGTYAYSAIDFYGDTDWWKVALVSGYGYRIYLQGAYYGVGTLVDPYLAIYNSAGVVQSWNNNTSGLNWDSYLYYAPSSSGTFFLSAEEFGNDATGTYAVTILRDELASTSSAATVAANSISAVGNIDLQADADWYRVTLTGGVQYQFDLIGSAYDGAAVGLTLADPYLFLRNSAGVALTWDNDSGLGANSRIVYTPSTSGTYFLDAQESGNDAIGTYRVTVNQTPTSGALTLGVAQSGAVDFLGDVDRYSVSLIAGVTYIFSIVGSSLLDPYLELQDINGSTLNSDDDGGSGMNSQLLFTPLTTGTYYLAARESGNDAIGNYSIAARVLATTSLHTNGDVAGGAISVSGETDWYSVNLVAGVTYQFSMKGSATGDGSLSDPLLTLYDQGSAWITSDDGGIGKNSLISFTPSYSGNYLLSAQGFGTSTGTYELFTVPNDASPATGAPTFSGNNIIDATTHGYEWNLGASRTVTWGLADSGAWSWTNAQQSADQIAAIFASVEAVANIHFEYAGYFQGASGLIAAGLAGVDISIAFDAAFFSSSNVWGRSNFPSVGAAYNPYPFGAGDILLNPSSLANDISYEPGSAGYFLILHELGHTLGLKHPHDSGGTGHPTFAQAGIPTSLDTDWATVMSYQDDYNWNLTAWDPATPMVLDVIALQYLYGANTSINAGNNTYSLLANSQYQTIWDPSGIDVVDASTSSYGWDIFLSLSDAQLGLATRSDERSLSSPTTLYWLMGGIENVTGSEQSDQIHGDALANILRGNGGDDSLEGGAGNDLMYGGTGNDTFDWSAQSDFVPEVRAGNDTMYGGLGDDVYVVSGLDQIVEFASEGVDKIWADQSWSLMTTEFVENLSLYGSSAANITGNNNAYGNLLIGNAANNFIDGGDGNDQMYGGGGDDTFDWNAALRAGDDTMYGGLGNDVYVISGVDVVTEYAGEGVDTIYTSQSYSLVALPYVENASLFGGLTANLMGNTGANSLRGNDANNILDGGAGNDTLTGGFGNDQLLGGDGSDTAMYLGAAKDYNVTWSAGTGSFTVVSSTEGTDTLTGIEWFTFSDGSVSAMTLQGNPAPVLTTLSPLDEATGVPVGTNIAITFNEAITRGNGTVSLLTSTGTVIASYDVATSSNIGISGNTLTINPTSDFDIFTTYKIEIAAGAIKDFDGNSFAGVNDYNFTTQTVDGLYHFFVVAFAAAPGVEYMNQLAEAWNFGLTLQQIVNIFTTKHQFTDTYPETMTNAQLTTQLVNNIVKSSASDTAKAEARADINWCLDNGWTRGDVIYTVFGNLATKPLSDPTWGQTALQFQNETAVAKYFTEVMHNNSTDLNVLRAIVGDVTQSTDVSTPEVIAALIGVELSHLG